MAKRIKNVQSINPFKFGCIVTGQDFCDRPELISNFIKNIKSNKTTVVSGNKQMGKSSAVCQAILSAHCEALIMDLEGIKTIDALVARIFRALFSKTNASKTVTETKFISRQRVNDPITGFPIVLFDGKKLKADCIAEGMALAANLYKTKRIVVVFDEFSSVLDLPDKDTRKVFSILKDSIGKHINLTYFFVGSKLKEMFALFNDSKSKRGNKIHKAQFFACNECFDIGPISEDLHLPFLVNKFASGNRKIEERIVRNILKISDNNAGFAQKLCAAVWEVSEPSASIGITEIDAAIDLILTRDGYYFEYLYGPLTAIQQKLIYTLARYGGKEIYSKRFRDLSGLSSTSAVWHTLDRLISLNLVYPSEFGQGDHMIADPFFRLYLLKKGQ